MNIYELSVQDKFAAFAGKSVKVTGTLKGEQAIYRSARENRSVPINVPYAVSA